MEVLCLVEFLKRILSAVTFQEFVKDGCHILTLKNPRDKILASISPKVLCYIFIDENIGEAKILTKNLSLIFIWQTSLL